MVKTNIADALQDKIDSKAAIKTALNLKGLTIANELLSEYAAKIADLHNDLALKNKILEWQASTDYVRVGGLKESTWNATVTYVTNSTWMMPRRAIFCKTVINNVRVNVYKRGNATAWKLKIFRYNEATAVYDLLRESIFNPVGTGAQTCVLTTPLEADVLDIIAVYIPASNVLYADSSLIARPYTRNASGDIISSNAFAGTADIQLCIDIFGTRPFLGIAGDSIISGFNGGNADRYYSPIHGSSYADIKSLPGGFQQSEPGFIIKNRIGSHLSYQNHGNTNTMWSHALSTYVPLMLASNPYYIVMAWGTNDINNGVTWETILGQLNSIKALIDASTVKKTFICEILPRTQFVNTMAATLRTWNANIAAWCTANNAILIQTHDVMGKIRTATNQLDDIKSEFNADSTHLSILGVRKFGEIIADAILKTIVP